MASEQLHVQQAVTLLQLEDVYEIATRVSEEFQELASQFGGSRLATVIPIVLDALEHLERAVTANQQLEIKVRRLILSNDALKREKEETSTELKVNCTSYFALSDRSHGSEYAFIVTLACIKHCTCMALTSPAHFP